MDQPINPDEFCRSMLLEYERQWSAAQGHAQRHPLRLKMASLEHLRSRGLTAEQLGDVLEAGAAADDAGLGLLCVDLAPRWAAAQRGERGLCG